MVVKTKSKGNIPRGYENLIEGESEWFDLNAASKPAIDSKKAKSIIDDLVKQFVDRTKKDINKWKLAREIAEQPDMPRWEPMQDILKDVSDDLHLESVIGQRIKKLTGCKYKLVDPSGKTDEEATKLLKKKWFKRLLRLHGEAKFYKYSLIQFGDITKDRFGRPMFKDVKLVDRRHIVYQERACLSNLSDTNGILFDERPWSLWTTFVDDETTDFGLIGKAAPLLLIKRNVMIAWAQFTEIFGLPFRKATTTTRDQNERARIEQMLSKMGKSAWGLFPEGTNLELVESNKTDSFKVFDAYIDRINSEISKAMLNQTGTTDEKAFVGGAKIHDETLDDIIQDDMTDTEYWLNDDIIPFLEKHGFPFGNLVFEWDNKKAETKTEKAEKGLKVSQMGYRPTKKWIKDELDVDVEDVEPAPEKLPEDSKKGKKKTVTVDPELNALYKQLKAIYK